MVIALLVHMLFLLLTFCDFHCSEIQSQEFQASVQETCQVLDIVVHLDSACRNVNGHPGDCVPGVFLELMSTYVLAIQDWRRAQDLGCRTTCGHGQRWVPDLHWLRDCCGRFRLNPSFVRSLCGPFVSYKPGHDSASWKHCRAQNSDGEFLRRNIEK